jgi:DNA-binding transcriptional MocR family regulator
MLRQMERSTIHLLAKRGKSQRQIALALGHSRTTVARALQEPLDQQPAARQRRSLTDPFQGQMTRWLQDGLTAVRMLELARADHDHPYTGGRSVFTDAVRRLRRAQAQADADVPVRFEGLPGAYLQVDWGDGTPRDASRGNPRSATSPLPSGHLPRATSSPVGSSTAARSGSASRPTCARRRSFAVWSIASMRWALCHGSWSSTT